MQAEDVAACWEGNAETWTRHVRAGYDLYRDKHNTPAFLAHLPPVAGLAGLDIGCGEGANTRSLAGLGARMSAIDIAPTFIRHAREAEEERPLGIAYQVADGMSLPFPDAGFDFATAFMSLMDMPNQAEALAEAFRVLRPGGFLQFSILHPCFATPHRKVLRDETGGVRAIEIADYFRETKGEIETWRFGGAPPDVRAEAIPFRVPRFHRTLSDWINLVVAAGFAVEHLHEPSTDEETARALPYLADTRVAPLFLHVRGRKAT